MKRRKPRRPWIKVLDKNGRVVQRCRDPDRATGFFVHYFYLRTDLGARMERVETGLDGYALMLDNQEYNAPIVQVARTHLPVGLDAFEYHRSLVKDKLEYLIEIHQAFYYG